jgi:tRNA(Glu) U13 pseudouridine synthase TruD
MSKLIKSLPKPELKPWLGIKRISAKPIYPNDFIVEEIPAEKINFHGKHAIFLLIKRNRTTLDVIKEICSKTGISIANIGFCGMKDKHAVTKQYISIKHNDISKFEKLDLKNASLKFIKFGPRLYLGDLNGNKFKITLRPQLNYSNKFLQKMFDNFKNNLNTKGLPNYFGLQRFGTKLNNHIFGYRLVKGIWKPKITKVKKRELKLYLHALQSFCFNEVLKFYVNEHDKTYWRKIRLIGYNTKLGNGIFDRYYKQLLNKISLKCDEFHIPWLKLTAYEGWRKVFIKPTGFKYEILNKKIVLSFTLPSGSYATVLLNEICCNV